MSFKWSCTICGKDIIVPYKSPQTMSCYSVGYCNKCFNENIEICEQTGEFYKEKDENGNFINAYQDIDGIIFECKEV